MNSPVGLQLGRRGLLISAGLLLFSKSGPAAAAQVADGDLHLWREQFERTVDHRLDVPPVNQQQYFELFKLSLLQGEITDTAAQAFVLVDRNPNVQAAFLVVKTVDSDWFWLGATAASTGKVGTFEHFTTPLGVFAHSLDNPDFRAEGTLNKNRIRGYGAKGRRIFDFGWQLAERGWGKGGISPMRLQMHATDPTVLEPRLGRVESEGCIRIPGTLNAFIDNHGVLDADYETALANGEKLWVIKPGRQLVPWPGRYMVIVDSQSIERPVWSPLPG